MLVACSTAQLTFGPYAAYGSVLPTTYAAGYGYNAVTPGRTALEVFPTQTLYNAYSLPYAYNYNVVASAAAAPVATVAAAAEPALAATPAAILKAADPEVEVVDAAAANEVELPQVRRW